MGLFDRMGRVVSSNFNALLDQLDNPKKSLELTIREMGDQLRGAQRHLVQSVAAEKQLRQRIETLDAEVARWEERAELAVRQGDDELARQALAQKRRLVAERDKAEALRGEQRASALEMKGELERMKTTLKSVELRQNTIAAQVGQARAGGGVEGLGQRGGVSPFEEMRRFETQVEGVDAAIEAQREVDEALGAGPGRLSLDEVEARFQALERDGAARGDADTARGDADTARGDADAPSEVERELSKLKQRVRVE